MDDQQFCESFAFNEFHRAQDYHTNNRAGVSMNYLAKMKKGTVHLVSDDADFFCRPGEYFFIPRACRYDSYWTASGEIVFDSLGFTLFPGDTQVLKMQKIELDEETEAIYRCLENDKTVSARTVAALYEIMARLMPIMETHEKGRDALLKEQAVAYMKTHSEFSVRDAAAYCGMSESMFYAAFRRAAGCTPIQMKHRLLAEKAVVLLQNTDDTVEDLCSRLGVSSPAYFRKILREVYGVTPKEIRGKRL